MSPPQSKTVSYADAVRILSGTDVQEDVNDACTKLTQAMTTMQTRFGSVAKQMHTLDLRRSTTPLKPRWDDISKEFAELLWEYRTNAGVISARLKLFSNSVLPVSVRNVTENSRFSREEAAQVFQTFMSISAEHATRTRSLVDRTLTLTKHMASFHTEFAKFTSQQLNNGQKELYDVSVKMIELEAQIRQICRIATGLTHADVSHLLQSTFRIVRSSGMRPTRSKLPNQRMNVADGLDTITKAYDDLDAKKSELCHAQYNVQLRLPQNDPWGTVHAALAPLVWEAFLLFESGLSLSLAAWTRLRDDCAEILQWIIKPGASNVPPSVVVSYQESGKTLYTPIAQALDVCVAAFEATLGRPS